MVAQNRDGLDQADEWCSRASAVPEQLGNVGRDRRAVSTGVEASTRTEINQRWDGSL
jgi:hypothetical protein